MRTYLGLNAPPAADPPAIIDIVFHLGRQRRFGGWADDGSWSVLHHTLLVQLIWLAAEYPHDELPWIMAHDLHEYITGDIPSPVKESLTMYVDEGAMRVAHNPLQALELSLDSEIAEVLHMECPPLPEARRRIKVVDAAALLIEASLFGPPGCINDVYRKALSKGVDFHFELFDVLWKSCGGWWSLALANRRRPYPEWLDIELSQAQGRVDGQKAIEKAAGA